MVDVNIFPCDIKPVSVERRQVRHAVAIILVDTVRNMAVDDLEVQYVVRRKRPIRRIDKPPFFHQHIGRVQ